MTLCNFNLPLVLPSEPAIDPVSDYPPPDTCTICEEAADC